MKNLFFTLILILVSSVLSELAEAQNLTDKKVESIKTEVETFFQEMLNHGERLDYSKLTLGVDDKKSAGFITNGKYYSQYSSLIDDMKLNAQGVDRQDFSIKEKKTTVLSENIVLMTVSGTAKAILTDTREITIGIHWSFVFEKINDSWKVIHSHQSREL